MRLKKKWRRGQDSNLHSLSAGGFQDRCTTIMRPLRLRIRTIPQALGLLNGEAVAFLGSATGNKIHRLHRFRRRLSLINVIGGIGGQTVARPLPQAVLTWR